MGSKKESLRVKTMEATVGGGRGDRLTPYVLQESSQTRLLRVSESWDSCLLLMGVASYLHREKLSEELQGTPGTGIGQITQIQPSHGLWVCSGERTPNRAGTLQRLSSLNKADQLAGRGRLRESAFVSFGLQPGLL